VTKWVEESNRGKTFAKGLVDEFKQNNGSLTPKDMRASSFIKNEGYPIKEADGVHTTKFWRIINSYSSISKAVYGPIFKVVEKLFFSDKNPLSRFFVKNVPVCDRAAHLENLMGDDEVTVGDFTSFECAMRGDFAKVICYCFLRMMGPQCDPELRKMLSWHMLGVNKSHFRNGVEVEIEETLMSGAVWTSFGNCMLSFFLVSYLRLKTSHPDMDGQVLARLIGEFVGLFEGDDSVTKGGAYDEHLIRALGLALKSKVHANCGLSEFCGICKPLGIQTMVTDPVRCLIHFYLHDISRVDAKESKLLALLRAKALSLYYQYRSCPVLSKFFFAILKKTRSIRADSSQLTYNRKLAFDEAAHNKFYLTEPIIDMRTRVFFSEQYDWTIDEQLAFEKDLDDVVAGRKMMQLPERLFRQYVDFAAKHVSFERERPYDPWNGKVLHNPEDFVGKGPFYLRELTHPLEYTAEARIMQKIPRAKFTKCEMLITPFHNDLEFFLV
jgi:hypothetical protein